jgi:hypothetical protein
LNFVSDMYFFLVCTCMPQIVSDNPQQSKIAKVGWMLTLELSSDFIGSFLDVRHEILQFLFHLCKK